MLSRLTARSITSSISGFRSLRKISMMDLSSEIVTDFIDIFTRSEFLPQPAVAGVQLATGAEFLLSLNKCFTIKLLITLKILLRMPSFASNALLIYILLLLLLLLILLLLCRRFCLFYLVAPSTFTESWRSSSHRYIVP